MSKCSVAGCGKRHNCKGMCKKHYMLWWRDKNPKQQKEISRRAKLKSEYGITQIDFETMFNAQKGRCAICRKHSKRLLCIDHCHATGMIRGLLCHNCNAGLGQFKDNRLFLARAAEYLLIHR